MVLVLFIVVILMFVLGKDNDILLKDADAIPFSVSNGIFMSFYLG
ncbi:hypothetical protein [Serratia liquefaciens]|nr:hypothetical protein [Serratia liquefaciens]